MGFIRNWWLAQEMEETLEPRCDEDNSKSAHSIELNEDVRLAVHSGVVNIFALEPNGRRWPMTSVQGPLLIVGSSVNGLKMLVEGNLGTSMSVETELTDGDFQAWHNLIIRSTSDLGSVDLINLQHDEITDLLKKWIVSTIQRGKALEEKLLSNLERVNSSTDTLTIAVMKKYVNDPKSAFDETEAFPSMVKVLDALRVLGKFRGFEVIEPRNANTLSIDEVLEEALKISQLRSRVVSLEAGWTRKGTEALLGFVDDGGGHWAPVALIPKSRGYVYRASDSASPVRVKEGSSAIKSEALEIYPSFPRHRPASFRDMARLAFRGSRPVYATIALCSFAVAVIGLAAPILTTAVLGIFVPEENVVGITAVGIALGILSLAAGAFVIVQNLATSKLTQIAQLRVESALWDRTLSLPLSFFRQYSSGDLAYRISSVTSLKQLLGPQTTTTILATVFASVNLYILFKFNTSLAVAATLVILLTIIVMLRLVRKTSKLVRRANLSQQEASSWFVQLVSGISKVRVAGAERRFTDISLLKQADLIASQAAQTLLMGRLQSVLALISGTSTLIFFVIVGYLTWGPQGPVIDATSYVAFATAFGTLFGAIVGLSAAVPAIASAGPTVDLVRPILESIQEQDGVMTPLKLVHGKYEFKDVSFQYFEGSPLVLNGFTCTTEPGAMTAIVGASGSGKTTAIRLMTGLEYPTSGSLLIDGHDVRSVNPNDLRKNLGVVIQGGQLSNGSILSNIGGGAEISEEVAWVCASQARIADDIAAMPMKMHTVINPLTLSGGQTQRILIARALARNPSVILFDEATSALDNENQKAISQTLSALPITQVVIAQRISTIKNASKILVLENGYLVEQGNFDELMTLNRVFAGLAKRQVSEG